MGRTLFGLGLTEAALDYIDRMPSGKIRAQLTKKAKSLIYNPHPPGCKKLKGMMEGDEQVWRVRSGDYRILYVVREIEVIVIDIDNRKDVYR
jgi:mRNA interferase RelE/StbE